MKKYFDIKKIWLAVAIVSMILLAFRFFGYDSEDLETSLLALNIAAFLLALPSSLFVAVVAVAANYYMVMSPVSDSAIYLNTIFLFIIGFVQWFWIARFWSGSDHRLQGIELYDVK